MNVKLCRIFNASRQQRANTQDEISPYFQCRENNKDFVYYLKGFSDGQSHFMTQDKKKSPVFKKKYRKRKTRMV